MESRVSQSSPVKQALLVVVCAAAGLALMFGAGFLLGVLLLVIAIAALLVSGRQKVTVDPAPRGITITWYYLVLKLRSGEDCPLFAPGRFYGGDRTGPPSPAGSGGLRAIRTGTSERGTT